MKNYRKVALLIGVLFIIGTVSGITGVVFLSSTIHSPDYLIKLSANEVQVIWGVLFIWLMGFSLALVPLFLYPILRKLNQPLAIGYVVFRGALETTTYIASGICMLLLLTLSKQYTNGGTSDTLSYQNLGFILMKARELSSTSTIFVFGLGALMFYVVLFQTQLIPRWLSAWGIMAIVLHLATGVLLLFGVQTEFSTLNSIMNFPIFSQEMVMAVWLIVKGFNTESIKTTIR